MNLINPYQLLGVNPSMPDLKQLKKSYYQLALLCHPDKGGNKESMDIVHKSYLYIKKQFANCQNLKTYEQLEKNLRISVKHKKKNHLHSVIYGKIVKNTIIYKNLTKSLKNIINQTTMKIIKSTSMIVFTKVMENIWICLNTKINKIFLIPIQLTI